MYTVTTMKVNIRTAREKFSEIVNTVAIKNERVILMSKDRPKAAIVSLKDAELLEDRSISRAKRTVQLERIGQMRKRLSKKGVVSSSALTIKKLRRERIEQVSNSD